MSVSEENVRPARRPRGYADTRNEDHNGNLIASIAEDGVIPELLQTHATARLKTRGTASDLPPHASDAVVLSEALLGWRDEVPAKLVKDMMGRGLSGPVLAEGVLGATARILGDLWAEDGCSFFQVSLAMAELQSLLRAVRHEPADALAAANANATRSVLLATVPGEQHSFGISVLEAGFAEAGWKTEMLTGQSFGTLCNRLSQEKFDLLALSCSVSGLQEGVKTGISRARSKSLNRQMKVIVGGYLQSQEELFARGLGADASAGDLETALIVANRFFAEAKQAAT